MNQERRNKRNAQYKINLEKRYGITKNSDWLEWGSSGIEKSEERNPMDGHYEFALTRNKKGRVVTRNMFVYKWTAQAKAMQKLYHDTKNGIPEKPKKPLNLFFNVPRTKEEIKEMNDAETVDALNSMWSNFCITDAFEPGSTVKPIVMASALEKGKISTIDTFLCDGGNVQSVVDFRHSRDFFFGRNHRISQKREQLFVLLL